MENAKENSLLRGPVTYILFIEGPDIETAITIQYKDEVPLLLTEGDELRLRQDEATRYFTVSNVQRRKKINLDSGTAQYTINYTVLKS